MRIIKSWKLREVGTEAFGTLGSLGRALHCELEPGRALSPSLLLTAAPCQPCHGAGVALTSTYVYVRTRGIQKGRIPCAEGKQLGGIAAFMQVSRAGGIRLAFNLFFFLRSLSEKKTVARADYTLENFLFLK